MMSEKTHESGAMTEEEKRVFDKKLRKALCIFGIQNLCIESGIKQNRFAKSLGVMQKTISVWFSDAKDNEYNCPNFSMLLKMCVVMEISMSELCATTYQALIKTESPNQHIVARLKSYVEIHNKSAFDEESETYNSSTAHKVRLRRYQHLKFTGYYYNTNRLQSEISIMHIETGKVLNEGYIRITMTSNEGVEYKGKIISPENQNYTYLYFERKDDFPEHGMLILRHPAGIQIDYMGGVGCMLSLSRGDRRVPTVQKVVLLNVAFGLQLTNDFLRQYLSLPVNLLDHEKLQFTDLREKNANYIERLKEMVQKQGKATPQ